MAVVELWDSDRTAERAAEIILPVARLGIAKKVVVPGICIQRFVAEKFKDAAVIVIGT